MATTIFLVNPVNFGGGASYLLDTYSAAAAYSLRQLKTGVTNVVRVRRSGDNAESDFTADEITDGTLTTWTGANDGFVVTWYDQSGSGNNVTQSTAGNQPRIVNSGVVESKGSLPAVRFINSSNTSLVNSSSAFINLVSTSYFSVSSALAGGTFGAIFSQGVNSIFSIRQFCDARTTPNRNFALNNTVPTNYYADLSATRNDTNQRLLSAFIDASNNASAFDNGSTGGTFTYTGTVDNNGLEIGLQRTSGTPNSPLNGYIQEVIIFNTDESANRTAIESDINTYYSIY